MTRIEFLEEIKEGLTNQISCISDSLLRNTPNERFRDEWERVQERLKIVNDLIKDEKQKNIPEQVEDKIECRKFNFIDENFGVETKNTLLWNNNSFVLISIFENDIFIKKYDDVIDLFKEFISNKNELEFLRILVENQEREIGELEAKNNEKKNDKI